MTDNEEEKNALEKWCFREKPTYPQDLLKNQIFYPGYSTRLSCAQKYMDKLSGKRIVRIVKTSDNGREYFQQFYFFDDLRTMLKAIAREFSVRSCTGLKVKRLATSSVCIEDDRIPARDYLYYIVVFYHYARDGATRAKDWCAVALRPETKQDVGLEVDPKKEIWGDRK